MIFREDGSVWFRQSWLDTALRCGERGRQAIVRPEWDQATSDSAAIGTAAHAGIEAVLNHEINPKDIGDYAANAAVELTRTETINWTKYTTPGELAAHASRCAEVWRSDIYPSVPLGGRAEVEFEVPLFTRPDGRVVGLKGMIDYIPPTSGLWDWKTAARAYNRDKQRFAIQPTVYAAALIYGGLGSQTEWPVRFTYGVMIRGEKNAKAQILEVQRSASHVGWLTDHLNTFVTMAEKLGLDTPWPRDDDHFLCSQKWCPWWSVCKGARLTDAEDRWNPDR
jgi:hypothetical protein